jgi:tRNA (pseudouridine54-N1)-methyltransferase
MREFVVYSRTGKTSPNFRNLREGGRLDVVYQCILMALFRSHGIRRDVVFHAILNGAPKPPLELIVNGEALRNVRTDENTWEDIIRNVLSGKSHPGVYVKKNSLQQLIKDKKDVFVLEESGEDIKTIELGTDPVFVLGDHVGLPRNEERFVLRCAKKVSLGKTAYLAAACVSNINYILDLREKIKI